MRSILQTEKECYITGAASGLHKHHIYGGPNRAVSEKMGFWVWLRADWHNLSSYGVHSDHSLDMRLKQACQRAYEKDHSRAEFMALIGRNYLEEEDV